MRHNQAVFLALVLSILAVGVAESTCCGRKDADEQIPLPGPPLTTCSSITIYGSYCPNKYCPGDAITQIGFRDSSSYNGRSDWEKESEDAVRIAWTMYQNAARAKLTPCLNARETLESVTIPFGPSCNVQVRVDVSFEFMQTYWYVRISENDVFKTEQSADNPQDAMRKALSLYTPQCAEAHCSTVLVATSDIVEGCSVTMTLQLCIFNSRLAWRIILDDTRHAHFESPSHGWPTIAQALAEAIPAYAALRPGCIQDLYDCPTAAMCPGAAIRLAPVIDTLVSPTAAIVTEVATEAAAEAAADPPVALVSSASDATAHNFDHALPPTAIAAGHTAVAHKQSRVMDIANQQQQEEHNGLETNETMVAVGDDRCKPDFDKYMQVSQDWCTWTHVQGGFCIVMDGWMPSLKWWAAVDDSNGIRTTSTFTESLAGAIHNTWLQYQQRQPRCLDVCGEVTRYQIGPSPFTQCSLQLVVQQCLHHLTPPPTFRILITGPGVSIANEATDINVAFAGAAAQLLALKSSCIEGQCVEAYRKVIPLGLVEPATRCDVTLVVQSCIWQGTVAFRALISDSFGASVDSSFQSSLRLAVVVASQKYASYAPGTTCADDVDHCTA